MNPRRFATLAVALYGTVFLAWLAVAWPVGFGSAGIENTGAVPIEDRRTALLTANAEIAAASQPTAKDTTTVTRADVATVAESVTGTATDTTPASSDEMTSTVAPAQANSPQVQPPEPQPVQVASASTADPVRDDARDDAKEVVGSIESAPQATAMGNAAVARADMAATAESGTETANDTRPAPDEPKSIVEAALPDSPQALPPESPPVQVATASTADPVRNDAKEAAGSVEILDECFVVDTCIDRYLWALYQRTPKTDAIKVEERRKVTVKRKGKTVTVTKSFTKLLDEDFTWKDPKAAEQAGMTITDYVIGGMDRSFKLRLFYMLHAAEEAGLSPGITSAFRDDYRQSIASGLKAATDRSYHGGSFRGGYGHGLAVDVVSVKGATRAQRWISTESFWKWIDEHGKDFGIGRPYLDRDPPHLAPIDGKEYADHHGGTKAQHAEADTKKHGGRLAARDDRGAAKTPKKRKVVEGSKVRTI
jgi:D-alanyl-D-alanine carboxypeptidase